MSLLSASPSERPVRDEAVGTTGSDIGVSRKRGVMSEGPGAVGPAGGHDGAGPGQPSQKEMRGDLRGRPRGGRERRGCSLLRTRVCKEPEKVQGRRHAGLRARAGERAGGTSCRQAEPGRGSATSRRVRSHRGAQGGLSRMPAGEPAPAAEPRGKGQAGNHAYHRPGRVVGLPRGGGRGQQGAEECP